ncbi:FtsX-like permease family protein [Actinoplanes friuliensis]|uniref:Putative permease n=1 Tax=Actinoplanes friuliensis DSM 7358 TaxID=1246995 RepID=U5W9V5_9ACTN|nr:FtsX-like permease family protein [Actinoplanes friuliensis]AGZ44760.1 putative permease [Actinoplanes friuliensis DSM 7358]
MLALVLGAVRARLAQALTLLVLTGLIAAVAAAGPWYALAAGSRAADGDVASAPASQRTLSVRKIASTNGLPEPAVETFAGAVRGLLPLTGLQPVLGMTVGLAVDRGDARPSMSVSYRENFCDHVRLTGGSCPAAAYEGAISQDAAEQLGLRLGDSLKVQASQNTLPVTLKVVATYVVVDPAGSYWSNKLYRANGGIEPAFTVLDTFTDDQLTGPTITYDVEVPAELIRGDDGFDLGTRLSAADSAFTQADLRLVNPTWMLLATIARDRDTIRDGVVVALGQVLVLGLFAIGLAGRYTGRERRGDAALLKLRGSTRRGLLGLALGQHLVPMLAGALLGAPLGFLLARLLAGPVRGDDDRLLALGLAAAAVGATLLGGLLVLTVLEAAVLRIPVAGLIGRAASGRRDWRADVIDLVLLAVAVGATYQVRAGQSTGGLALVAPALVALAVALLFARLLGRLADRVGGAALHAGRLRLGLTAAQASRRPGIDRVFALVAVAVAIFVSTAGVWSAGREARVQRSEVELGATRVLSVQASNRTALEAAVRRADPGGKNAMAAVIDRESVPPVVAVDTSRLAAITRWRPEYGSLTTLAQAGDAQPLPPPAMVTGTGLTLRMTNDAKGPIRVSVVLQHEGTGIAHVVTFGPLKRGEHTVRRPVEGCTEAPGCRLVRWQLVGTDSESALPPVSAAVTLTGLSQQGPDGTVLDGAALGDSRRWRPDFRGAGVDVFAADGRLKLVMDRNEAGVPLVGNKVYAVDAALPLPIVLAGESPPAWQFSDPILYSFGGAAVRVRVAGTASVLPVVGRDGVLVDLETARRVAAEGDLGGTFQVWLAADAPDSVVDALRANGLTILGSDDVPERAALLGDQGTAVAATFALLAASVGLLLAAAAMAVAAAVERGRQAEQLLALRVQGMSLKNAVAIGYAGSGALVVAGLLTGLVAAAIARPAVGVQVRPFTDGWNLVPPPGALGAAALLLAGLVALLVLGVTGWLSVRPLVRTLRRSGR